MNPKSEIIVVCMVLMSSSPFLILVTIYLLQVMSLLQALHCVLHALQGGSACLVSQPKTNKQQNMYIVSNKPLGAGTKLWSKLYVHPLA